MAISIPLGRLGCSCENYLCVLWCGELLPSQWPWKQCQGFIPWALEPVGKLQSMSNIWCPCSNAAAQPGSEKPDGGALTVPRLCADSSKGCGEGFPRGLSGYWGCLGAMSENRGANGLGRKSHDQYNTCGSFKGEPAAAICFHDPVVAGKVMLGSCIHFNRCIYKSVGFSLERAFCQCNPFLSGMFFD